MTQLVIKAVDESNLADVGQCDSEFVIDSQLMLHAENNQIRYTLVDRPVSKKRYVQDEVDYAAYIDDPQSTILLAYVGGKVAGQIMLRRHWNRYAIVDDITVDVQFRRAGVGRALMAKAKQWAREKQLPGIVLETQNNNVQACRFYEGCGFHIGGFDNDLYQGLERSGDEIALYWYFHFEETGR